MSESTAGESARDLLRSELISHLTRKPIHYSAERRGDARVLAGAQPSAWRQLVNYVTKQIVTDREEKAQIESLARGLLNSVEPQAGHTSISEIAPGSGWAVDPVLPIIDPTWIERNADYLKSDGWFGLAAILGEIASQSTLIRSIRTQYGPALTNVMTDPRYITAAAEVAMMRTADAGAISRTLAELEGVKAALRKEINNVSAQNARFEVALAAHDEDWANFQTQKEQDIAALRQQVADSIRLDASHELWRKRSKAHLLWMLGAFAVMVAGIAAVVASVIFYALPMIEPTVFEIITRSGFATQKLILISLCVIGAAWLLRFVARAIVDNMSLRADAQHRQSMLETYLALRGEVGLKDEERMIILTALFRPLPGQTADENPPTPVTEAFRGLVGR